MVYETRPPTLPRKALIGFLFPGVALVVMCVTMYAKQEKEHFSRVPIAKDTELFFIKDLLDDIHDGVEKIDGATSLMDKDVGSSSMTDMGDKIDSARGWSGNDDDDDIGSATSQMGKDVGSSSLAVMGSSVKPWIIFRGPKSIVGCRVSRPVGTNPVRVKYDPEAANGEVCSYDGA